MDGSFCHYCKKSTCICLTPTEKKLLAGMMHLACEYDWVNPDIGFGDRYVTMVENYLRKNNIEVSSKDFADVLKKFENERNKK
jgi:hypothetical protein